MPHAHPVAITTKQAKDFLVQQTAEQAARENIPLSEIEKKMMYFTENDPASCPDAMKVIDEFDAQYDTAEYEIKMSKLLHHAYKRLKEENPEAKRNWDEAIRTLEKGDHYLPVLWDKPTGERPPHDSLKLFGTALLVVAALVAFLWLMAKYNIDLDRHHILGSTRFIAYLLIILIFALRRPARALYKLVADRFRRGRS